jgi:hypothetical protein
MRSGTASSNRSSSQNVNNRRYTTTSVSQATGIQNQLYSHGCSLSSILGTAWDWRFDWGGRVMRRLTLRPAATVVTTCRHRLLPKTGTSSSNRNSATDSRSTSCARFRVATNTCSVRVKRLSRKQSPLQSVSTCAHGSAIAATASRLSSRRVRLNERGLSMQHVKTPK